MRKAIVNASGKLVYLGNERNEKFGRLAAQPGNATVEMLPEEKLENHWDGSKWSRIEPPRSAQDKARDTLRARPDATPLSIGDLKALGLI